MISTAALQARGDSALLACSCACSLHKQPAVQAGISDECAARAKAAPAVTLLPAYCAVKKATKNVERAKLQIQQVYESEYLKNGKSESIKGV